MRLRRAIAAEWPKQVIAFDAGGEYLVLQRPDRGDRIVARWVPGRTGTPVVAVHEQGSKFARFTDEVEALIKGHRSVLILNTFQTGISKVPHDRIGRWFLSYNRSDDAERVQDILTALAWVRHQASGTPKLLGMGQAGVWCLFAAAIAPIEVELSADLSGFKGSDEDFRRHFFVPGIQRAGGLDAALHVLNNPLPSVGAQ
jgi:hypothetical protein